MHVFIKDNITCEFMFVIIEIVIIEIFYVYLNNVPNNCISIAITKPSLVLCINVLDSLKKFYSRVDNLSV